MKGSRKHKTPSMAGLDAKITKVVIREVNGEPVGGYVEVKVKFKSQWRVLFFRLNLEDVEGGEGA